MLQISALSHTDVCLLDLKQRSINSSFKGLMEKLWLREPLHKQVQNIPEPADIVPVGIITIVFNQQNSSDGAHDFCF